MTWNSTISPLLKAVDERTNEGSLEWSRSTRNQVYATVPGESRHRVVLTRYVDGSTLRATIAAVGGAPVWEAKLTVSPIDSNGKVLEPSIVVDSELHKRHRDTLLSIEAKAQELADAPRRAVETFLAAMESGLSTGAGSKLLTDDASTLQATLATDARTGPSTSSATNDADRGDSG